MKKYVIGWRAKNGLYTKHFYALSESEENALGVLGKYKNMSRLEVRYVFEADSTTAANEKFLS